MSSTLNTVSVDPDLKTVHGRLFNTETETYLLPADKEEHTRLDVQHSALKAQLGGGLYAQPELVRAVLLATPRRDGRRPTLLDVGAGSGIWAIEIAKEFPDADIVGMDLVKPQLLSTTGGGSAVSVPSNLRFEIGEAKDFVSRYTEAFDVVHMRSVESGIDDLDLLLYYVARSLRVGGVLLLVSTTVQFEREDGSPLPVVDEGQPGFTHLQRMFWLIYEVALKRGNFSLHSPLFFDQYLQSNPNYERIVYEEQRIALGPTAHPLPPEKQCASDLFRRSLCQSCHAVKPYILSSELDEQETDTLINNTIKEITDGSLQDVYIKWRYYTAVRKDVPWTGRDGPAPVIDHSAVRMVVNKT